MVGASSKKRIKTISATFSLPPTGWLCCIFELSNYAEGVRRTVSKCTLPSAQLFSEAPDAQRQEHERDDRQPEEVGPQSVKPTSFQHAAARDNTEVMNRIDDHQRLQPFRHCFDRVECAR